MDHRFLNFSIPNWLLYFDDWSAMNFHLGMHVGICIHKLLCLNGLCHLFMVHKHIIWFLLHPGIIVSCESLIWMWICLFVNSCSEIFIHKLGQRQRGVLARSSLLRPGGLLACELARHAVVLKVDDWVFCHGGLLPHHGKIVRWHWLLMGII